MIYLGIASQMHSRANLVVAQRGALEVVEDDSSIAVFLGDTLSDHFSEYFLGDELVL
jgi:hypothetical protein